MEKLEFLKHLEESPDRFYPPNPWDVIEALLELAERVEQIHRDLAHLYQDVHSPGYMDDGTYEA